MIYNRRARVRGGGGGGGGNHRVSSVCYVRRTGESCCGPPRRLHRGIGDRVFDDRALLSTLVAALSSWNTGESRVGQDSCTIPASGRLGCAEPPELLLLSPCENHPTAAAAVTRLSSSHD